MSRGCSCHIKAPCAYCEASWECEECGEINNPFEEEGCGNEYKGKTLCDRCLKLIELEEGE